MSLSESNGCERCAELQAEIDRCREDVADYRAAHLRSNALAHITRRMLQALDAYWLVYEGGGPEKWRHPHSDDPMQHWWGKFERYRARVEEAL